ncbi:MAG: peptidoglycan-binding domain-containing protein, partial [Gammaproteobacteria bacterium]
MQILRRGNEGDEVRRWQHFLLGQGLLAGVVDGVVGPVTEAATRTFQRRERLEADGVVGPRTLAKALERGFDLDFTDPHGGTSGAEFPPRASFAPLTANAERQEIFGKFAFERIAPGKDAIRI